jgi:dihydrofolate reductase
MRKIKYHCAISLDGFVARKDGSFDCFVLQGPHMVDFVQSFAGYDVALMGRKTYEVGLKVGITNPYPTMKTYVFSRTLEHSPDANVSLVSSGALDVVRGLKRLEGKDIWVAGAGDFASTLFAHDLIDEVVLKVNPLMLGQGIPVVAHLDRPTRFQLTSSKVYDNGVVMLAYRTLPTGV